MNDARCHYCGLYSGNDPIDAATLALRERDHARSCQSKETRAHAKALDRIKALESEILEARNEADAVRRAYLHEKHRAETAIAALRAYDPKGAARLVHWEYRGTAA